MKDEAERGAPLSAVGYGLWSPLDPPSRLIEAISTLPGETFTVST